MLASALSSVGLVPKLREAMKPSGFTTGTITTRTSPSNDTIRALEELKPWTSVCASSIGNSPEGHSRAWWVPKLR